MGGLGAMWLNAPFPCMTFPHRLRSALNLQSCRLLITGFLVWKRWVFRSVHLFSANAAAAFCKCSVKLIFFFWHGNPSCGTKMFTAFVTPVTEVTEAVWKICQLITPKILIKEMCNPCWLSWDETEWWRVMERWHIVRQCLVSLYLSVHGTQ